MYMIDTANGERSLGPLLSDLKVNTKNKKDDTIRVYNRRFSTGECSESPYRVGLPMCIFFLNRIF